MTASTEHHSTAAGIATGDDEVLLELSGISKRYGNTYALDGVDLKVGVGEIVGLLGDNGAGKSTLVKIMSGVVAPDRGTYRWQGEDLGRPDRTETEKRGVETIFQDSALVPTMSITRNIFMGREITNWLGMMRTQKMNSIASRILDSVVTIEGIRSPRQLVGSLSGGQQQAVAIARAVHFKRSLLILDEPTSALAVRATEALLKYLEQLRDEGVSSVLVTHNLHHAYQVCDRHIVMHHGRKILDKRKSETSIDELTAAVVEGKTGLKRLAAAEFPTAQVQRRVRLSSLYDDLVASGQQPSTKVLRCETVPADEQVAGKLHVDPGTPVLELERVRYAGSTPLALMRNWLDLDTVGEITRSDLEGTGLYDLLRKRGVEPGEARQVVGGKAASQYEASVLKLPAGSPLVTMSRVMRDSSGHSVEYGSHVYDATQYSLESDVSPGE